ncbi:uncharacterized protein LOC794481 [Danio rerio]|uniref:Uncharacterized protein LOC794481 n=1 Tax=Danio rerio TaxID=7955 RepID=A9UL54_DANRE|nr:uncharacterized protein LOC794481 [Danio rerio]XP_021324200.1 uncharacterized protein LOC794481 isoform X1 [Danio rerio]AAI55801.1 Zgc:174972 protein [Danio rerio]|eukprot:NP_001107924.1 uncharacterized protein LOC794481 [Danio rerio]
MGVSLCRTDRWLLAVPGRRRSAHKGCLTGEDEYLDGLDRQEDRLRTHPSRTSVKTSYMVRAGQNTVETYRYIDCGSNSTVHQPSGLAWSKAQNRKLLR